MATAKKKTSSPKKKAAAKKPAAKKAPAKAKASTKAAAAAPTGDMDRKGLAGRARQLKSELLAIRFNLQAPSLAEYRKKRRELASLLARLG